MSTGVTEGSSFQPIVMEPEYVLDFNMCLERSCWVEPLWKHGGIINLLVPRGLKLMPIC